MKIILFDGDCNVCNKSVQFIIKRDKEALFHFASLQSDIGKEILALNNIPAHTDSLVFLDENKAYTASSAVLRVCKYLPSFWKFFYVFLLVPRFIRNRVYRLVANNRYKFFGKNETCMLPTPEERKRFL